MFTDVSMLVSGRKRRILESETLWHNVFYKEIVNQVDEDIFSILYADKRGRPNASIRVLLGMMILKEGNGWSDEQLFEECRFNLKMMRALGIHNINEDVPAESTYYEFRKAVLEHKEESGEDLIDTSFNKITSKQAIHHGISGKKIRLDSKLINSNIARSSRLDLIVEAVRKYISVITIEDLREEIGQSNYEILNHLKGQSTSNFTYSLTPDDKKSMLIKMGGLIHNLLKKFEGDGSKNYQVLRQVYEQQYKAECTGENNESEGGIDKSGTSGKSIVPKSPHEIRSDSIQSIHDPEASYRTKGTGAGKQTVSGYHTNITETCDEQGGLNLITNVQTQGANISEDKFLTESIDSTEQLLNPTQSNEKAIEEVITDGGYDSKSNREEMLKHERPQWSIAKMKGRRHKYTMNYNEQGCLEVCDNNTNEQLEVHFSTKANKYVIKQNGKSNRYFTKEEINIYIQHQTVQSQVNTKSYNLRANVESTIHQVFHRLKKRNKTVYRGIIKSHWYALSRAFWVNMVRITAKEAKIAAIFIFLALVSLMRQHINKIRYRLSNYQYYPL